MNKAQARANFLAKKSIYEHEKSGKNSKYGQNLFRSSSSELESPTCNIFFFR